MKTTLTYILFGISTWAFAQFNPQPKAVTEAFFPEVDVAINTPSFQKEKGFTNYEEMMAFLDALVKAHPDKISYQFIGKSQKGKDIPLVSLHAKQEKLAKLKVWIQGGLHGNEPASTEGVLYLIEQLLNNPENAALLDAFDFGIVPMANIDGYEKQDRYAADGMDLNRDQTKLMEPESQYLKKAFSDFNADIALDFHEYRPYRRDYAQLGEWGVTGAFDVMFLYSGNLNVPESLRKYTRKHFVMAAEKRMDELGFSHHNYFSSDEYYNEIQLNEGSSNARSSATSFALSNCISTLVEVRGVGLGRTSFKRRTYITYNVAMSYLNYAYKNQNEVRAELMKSRTAVREQVVVTSDKTVAGVAMPFIDNSTYQSTQIELVVNDAWQSVPDLTRKCPTAYIILPGNDEIVKRLEMLGVTTETLATAQMVQVEK